MAPEELDLAALARRTERAARIRVGATFTAAWDVRDGCAECGGVILEGDRAGYVNDDVVCEDCHTAAVGD